MEGENGEKENIVPALGALCLRLVVALHGVWLAKELFGGYSCKYHFDLFIHQYTFMCHCTQGWLGYSA